jgi:hypothetical protein
MYHYFLSNTWLVNIQRTIDVHCYTLGALAPTASLSICSYWALTMTTATRSIQVLIPYEYLYDSHLNTRQGASHRSPAVTR